MRRLSASQALPSWRELDAQKRSVASETNAANTGRTVGGAIGTGLGLLASFTPAGIVAAPIAGSLGATTGEWIGSLVGAREADEASALAQTLASEREQAIEKEMAKRRAFAALINRSAD